MACKSSGNDKEEEDFLLCGICMEYYDVEGRTPKLLECFHSCCIACLKLQAVTSMITCPYCRQVTQIRNGVEKMTTNFYIVPQVQKMVAKRKTIEDMLAKTKGNLAESIARRRDVQSKLKMVENGLKMMENSIGQKEEDNNEKIAILQSLIEDPFLKQDMEELLDSYSKCETDHQYSKEELAAAEILGSSLSDMENFMCSLTLKKKTDGTSFKVKPLDEKILAFNNKSIDGPRIGSYHSVLTYILFQMRQEKLWEEAALDDVADNTSGADPPNRIAENENTTPEFCSLFGCEIRDTSDDTWSTSETESSSGQRHDMCYMQFRINNAVHPKVVFRLNFEEAPRMSARFMKLCMGSAGASYKSCTVFMNKDGESFTAGKYEDLDIVYDDDGCTPQGWFERSDSKRFIADQSTLDETRGALRMRHRGRSQEGVYVCSEFSVICCDHPNNSHMTTVFGYVHSGIEVCQNISRLDLVHNEIVVHSCGVWFD